MMCRFITLAVTFLTCQISLASDWNALVARYTNNSNSRVNLSREDLGETEYYARLADLRNDSADIAQKLVALIAETDANDPIRFFALELVLTDRHLGRSSIRAVDHLLDSELRPEQLSQICYRMAFGHPGPSPASESAIRKIVDASNGGPVSNVAKLCLARFLRSQIEDAVAVQRLPKRRDHVLQELGTDITAQLMNVNLAKLRQEALSLLEDVQGKFANEKMGSRSLNELAEKELHIATNQTIGCNVREISGADTTGKEFKLSEYDGRVRVLLFWGHWCAGCRKAYPVYRSLVSYFPESSFCLLGIDSDKERKTIQEVIEKQEVTWRCWWDSDKQIHEQWGLVGAPHIYVIDSHRRIAFVDVRGEELREAVKSLLEAPKE
jgi:peroxiredoxin